MVSFSSVGFGIGIGRWRQTWTTHKVFKIVVVVRAEDEVGEEEMMWLIMVPIDISSRSMVQKRRDLQMLKSSGPPAGRRKRRMKNRIEIIRVNMLWMRKTMAVKTSA